MNKTLLHISLIPGVGPAVVMQIARLLDYKSFDQLYTWSAQDFMYRARLPERSAHALVKGLFDTIVLDRELALIQKHGIKWVTVADGGYPALLRATSQPPIVLYWQGADLTTYNQSIAIVGSRKANAYGYEVIKKIVPELTAAGWSITSGGALGADTMAHRVAVELGVPTCAVIGAGLLKPYPASNRKLFEAIITQGGSLVSPFPLTMGALPGNFPARNRIISGISRATVVVQAAEKSGARITALYALEQGREVCAVPGPVYDSLSAGCHKLIKEGAALVTSGADILIACGYQVDQPHSKKADRAAVTVQVQPAKVESLPVDAIVSLCSTPQSFDDLLDALDYDFAQLQERLLTLQLEGAVNQDFMGRWCTRQ